MKQIEITKYLNKEYPEELASHFDSGKISLQFGSNNKEIKKVMIALDGTTDVVNQAIDSNCDLLICHHPFMFSPLLSLNYDSPFGQKLIKVLNNKLNIFSMHTNFDTGNNGMNDILSNELGLKNVSYIKDELDASCLLRIGNIDKITLADLIKEVSDKLNQPSIKYVGNPNKIIEKVGIVGGAGSSEVYNAIRNKCDCFITGEIQHHIGLDAIDQGICLIEVSHAVEAVFKSKLKDKLNNEFPELEIILANEEDPFKTYCKK